MFTKARQNRIFEDVIHQVEEAVIRGDLKPGDQLPPERELQRILEISRGTLRESLRVLEQKGLIEIKTGSKGGIFVKSVSSEPLTDNVSFFVRSHRVTLENLAEFREDLESLLSARAAQKAGPSDIETLKKLLSKSNELLAGGLKNWDGLLNADKEIHLVLADIAGNPIHHYFLETINENVHRENMRAYLKPSLSIMEGIANDLIQIVEAVENRDAAAAARLAGEHVKRYADYMKEVQGQMEE